MTDPKLERMIEVFPSDTYVGRCLRRLRLAEVVVGSAIEAIREISDECPCCGWGRAYGHNDTCIAEELRRLRGEESNDAK